MLVLGRNPLEKGWMCCRGLYLYSTHHSQETHPCPPAGFEPEMPAR